jgi:hypothetical protein
VGRLFLASTAAAALVVVATQLWNFTTRGSLAELALAKADAAEELGPLNRVVFTAFPFLAAVVYYASRFHARQRPAALALVALCAGGLALSLFKINLILFLLLLLFLSVFAARRAPPSLGVLLRSPRIAAVVVVLAVGMFHLSEGEGLATSIAYVAARILLFSWEGFAYVVEAPAAPDLGDQLAVFLGQQAGPSPDLLLATEMLHLDPAPFGIVVTYPGFLYRNWGEAGVLLGAVALGVAAQLAVRAATRAARPASVVLWLSTYMMLVGTFLVGNVFNSLRGELLTLLAVYGLVRLVDPAPSPSAATTIPAGRDSGRCPSAAPGSVSP